MTNHKSDYDHLAGFLLLPLVQLSLGQSYDSDNFVITHDDTQDDGAYGSEQEDLTPDSRRLRSRSQETYNRISSAASFKQSFNACPVCHPVWETFCRSFFNFVGYFTGCFY